MVLKRMLNPFIAGGPVPPEMFIGRERDVYAIMSRLVGGGGSSSAIHGEPRIGKTSLLHYLNSEKARADWDIAANDFTFIYLDCAGVGDPYRENFWKTVLAEMESKTGNRSIENLVKAAIEKEQFKTLALQDLFREVSNLNHRLVILLDEFENVVEKDRILLTRLRAFIAELDISLIVSTSKSLNEVVQKIDLGGGKTFDRPFNIRQLKAFNKKQTDLLIEKGLNGTGVEFSQEDYDFIWEESRGHPFKVQYICSELFEEYMFQEA